MGSPAHALSIDPRLRAWHEAGLTHLLVGQEIVDQLNNSLATIQQASAATSKPRFQVNQRSDVSTQQSVQQAKTTSPSQAAPTFPRPWDFFWTKAIIGAKIVFTYPELSLDLLGRGDKRRGQFFREILIHLQWAGKNIVSFWPMNDGASTDPNNARKLFWAGIKSIGAQHIACYGLSGYEAITGQSAATSGSYRYGPYFIHVLPSPNEMYTMLPHERHMASDILKSIRFDT